MTYIKKLNSLCLCRFQDFINNMCFLFYKDDNTLTKENFEN